MRFGIVSTLLLVPLAVAETVQDLWNFPDAPDFTSNITAGSTVKIAWTATLNDAFSIYCSECDLKDVDLWLTVADGGDVSASRRIKAGLNLMKTHSVKWTADLDPSDVKASIAWNFRFIPSGSKWDGSGGQEISSSQFRILDEEPSSSSGTATVTSKTTTPTPTSTSTRSTDSAIPTTATSTTTTGSDSSASTTTEASSPSATPDATPGETVPPGGAAASLRVGVALGAITVLTGFMLL